MNIEDCRQKLMAKERELVARTERAIANARERGDEAVHDVGDESVADEMRAEQFTEAEAGSAQLAEVRDALRRIAEGTFGSCVVDGGPIEEKRLEAMPWTPYCLKHQELREAAGQRRMPTL